MQNYREEDQGRGYGNHSPNTGIRNEEYRAYNRSRGFENDRNQNFSPNMRNREGRNPYEGYNRGMENRGGALYHPDRAGGGMNMGGGSTWGNDNRYGGYSPENKYGSFEDRHQQRGERSDYSNRGEYSGNAASMNQDRRYFPERERNWGRNMNRGQNINYGTPTSSGGRFDNDRYFEPRNYRDDYEREPSFNEEYQDSRNRSQGQGASRSRDYLGGYNNQGGSRYDQGNTYSSNTGERHENYYGSKDYDRGREGGYYRMSQYNENERSRSAGSQDDYRRNYDQDRY